MNVFGSVGIPVMQSLILFSTNFFSIKLSVTLTEIHIPEPLMSNNEQRPKFNLLASSESIQS